MTRTFPSWWNDSTIHHEILDDVYQIAETDPEIVTCQWSNFLAVMFPDDNAFRVYKIRTRDRYEDLLRDVYRYLHQ